MCAAGSFTSGGTSTTRSSCATCPAGFACEGGSARTACGADAEYSAAGASIVWVHNPGQLTLAPPVRWQASQAAAAPPHPPLAMGNALAMFGTQEVLVAVHGLRQGSRKRKLATEPTNPKCVRPLRVCADDVVSVSWAREGWGLTGAYDLCAAAHVRVGAAWCV